MITDATILVAGALASTGVLVFARAMLWDWLVRGRHRPRRCPRCWYDCQAIDGLTCPECGYVARRERALHRSRRRWRQAGLGLLGVVAGLTVAGQHLYRVVDWVAASPSWLLVHQVEDLSHPALLRELGMPDLDERRALELWGRYEAGLLPAGVKRRIAARRLTPEDMRGVVQAPVAWPKRHALHVTVQSDGVSGPLPRRIVLTPLFDGGRVIMHGDPGWLAGAATLDVPMALGVGVPPADASVIRFDVRVCEGDDEIRRETVDVPLRLVDGPDDVLETVRSPELDRLLAHAFGDSLRRSADSRWLEVAVPRDVHREPPLGVPIVFEFRHHGERVAWATLSLVFRSERDQWFADLFSPVRWCRIEGDVDRLHAAAGDDWVVVVRGDGVEALRRGDVSRYWAGRFELPLTDVRADPW